MYAVLAGESLTRHLFKHWVNNYGWQASADSVHTHHISNSVILSNSYDSLLSALCTKWPRKWHCKWSHSSLVTSSNQLVKKRWTSALFSVKCCCCFTWKVLWKSLWTSQTERRNFLVWYFHDAFFAPLGKWSKWHHKWSHSSTYL